MNNLRKPRSIDRKKKRKTKNKIEFRYNEERSAPLQHRYPNGVKPDIRKYPGAGARMAIEDLASSLIGMHEDTLSEMGISKRDIINHNREIFNALMGIIREGPSANDPRMRGAAVAYLGELKMQEAIPVLAGLGTSATEASAMRGLAAESLCRIGGDKAAASLCEMLEDPDAVVRARSVNAVGVVGGEAEGKLVASLAAGDTDPEVRRVAGINARKLLPKQQHDILPPLPKKSLKKNKGKLIKEENIQRPIGRHTGAMPQTLYTHDHHEDEKKGYAGGVDLLNTRRHEGFQPGMASVAPGYEFYSRVTGEENRVVITGSVPEITRAGGYIYRDTSGEKIIDIRDPDALKPGRPLPFQFDGDELCCSTPTYVPGISAAPVITDLSPNAPVIWSKQSFGIRIRFRNGHDQRPKWLKLKARFPKGDWEIRWFEISHEDCEKGECIVNGFRCAEAGRVTMQAVIYGERGGASRAEAQYNALPLNPHSVSIVPQTTGTNGEGPAHYNSSEDRFYCYASCTFTNGNASSITVGPTVTCRVTDGGNHVATFSFSIGVWTVAAQSSLVLGIYTFHGSSSDVYDVFEDFGDVTMEFTFESSNGSISDSNVWAAMAQLRLALNFVGNMSSSDRATFQSIVENEASAIVEQQSLYYSETQRFLLPSNDPDWGRYRDIEMDDNKTSDCTAGSDEADDLRDDWSSPTDWLDVWVVESFSGPACAASVGGFSPNPGPVSKGGKKSGAVIQLAGINMGTASGRNLMGIIVAHEVGHYLDLDHVSDSSNFMAASTGGTNTGITHAQYLEMTEHGYIERIVP